MSVSVAPATQHCLGELKITNYGRGVSLMLQRIRSNNFPRRHSSTAFVPLTIFRGLAGVAFICFGEFFWMHLHRIDLGDEGKILGWIALSLGVLMVFGAVMGTAGVSFSPDEGCQVPLLLAVYLSLPLSALDFLVAVTFVVNRARLVRLDRQHSQEHWRPPRGSDQDGHAPDDSFRRVYDLFIFLALAFSVLEALMFRLGKRWLLRTAHGQSLGQDGELSSEPLKSLLDDDDLQEAGWYKGNENTQRDQQIYEELRRSQQETNEDLLEYARGGQRNAL